MTRRRTSYWTSLLIVLTVVSSVWGAGPMPPASSADAGAAPRHSMATARAIERGNGLRQGQGVITWQQEIGAPQPPTCRKGVWCSLRSPNPTTMPFKVWTRGTGNGESDRTALATTVTLFATIWGPMTALMGQPLRDKPRGTNGFRNDDGNDDSAIDIYLVEVKQPVRRDGESWKIEPATPPARTAQAITLPTSASGRGTSNRTSAFILIDRQQLSTSGAFKSIIIHEFFHALQDRYNAYTSNICRSAYWFVEASATWAETYFAPDTAHDQVYAGWVPQFQRTDQGLTSTDQGNDYASFMWPYFMEQDKGPQAIANAWKAMGTESSCSGLNDAINKQLSFDDTFHIFALRNLNTDRFGTEIPGLDHPYTELHSDWIMDEGSEDSPGPYSPTISNEKGTSLSPLRGDEPSRTFTVHIDQLKAVYYHWKIDINESLVYQLRFDFSKIGQLGNLDIDALLHNWQTNKWTYENLKGKDHLCLDDGSVDDLYFILSNHGRDKRVTGQFGIKPSPVACNCGDATLLKTIQVSAEYTYSRDAGSGGDTGNVHVDFIGEVQGVVSMYGHLRKDGITNNDAVSGTMEVHERSVTGDPPKTYTVDGKGSPVDASNIRLYVNPAPWCSYDVQFDLNLPAINSEGRHEFAPIEFDTGDIPMQGDLHMSGSKDVDASANGGGKPDLIDMGDHTVAPGYFEMADIGVIGDPLPLQLNDIEGTAPGAHGTAHLTWTVTPLDVAQPQP